MCSPSWPGKQPVQVTEDMKQFFSFVIKEAKHILRDKRTMLILFGMPIMLMLLFGFAITTDVRNVRTVVVTSQMDHLTQQVVERLAQSEYFDIVATVPTPQEAAQMMRSQKADLAMVFAPDFASKKSGLQLIVDGADPNMSQQWTLYAQGVIANMEGGVVNTKMLYNPRMKSAYNFVPAIMGMLLMLICAMMTSSSSVRENVVILLMARYVMGVPLAGSLFWILAVSVLYILLALSLGLLISNIAKTQLVALLASAMLLLMPVVMLSGMLFPVESMPRVLQWVSAIVPPRYYIQAMRKLMIMGVGIDDVMKEVLVMLGMTVFLLTIALKKFNTRLE